MELQIAKWGNSLAVRIPSAIAKKMHVAEGDSVDVTLNSTGELVMTPAKVFDKAAFLRQLDKHTEKLPKGKGASVIETLRNNSRY